MFNNAAVTARFAILAPATSLVCSVMFVLWATIAPETEFYESRISDTRWFVLLNGLVSFLLLIVALHRRERRSEVLLAAVAQANILLLGLTLNAGIAPIVFFGAPVLLLTIVAVPAGKAMASGFSFVAVFALFSTVVERGPDRPDIAIRVLLTMAAMVWPLAILLTSTKPFSRLKVDVMRALALGGALLISGGLAIYDLPNSYHHYASFFLGIGIWLLLRGVTTLNVYQTILMVALILFSFSAFSVYAEGMTLHAYPFFLFFVFLTVRRSFAVLVGAAMLSVPLATLDVLDPLVFRQSIGGLVFAIALSVLVGGSDTGEQERFDIAKLRQVLVAFLVAAALVGVASFDVFLFEVSFASDRDVLRHGLLSVFAIALGTWLLWAMIADRDQAQQRLLDTVVRNTERAMAEKAKLERTAQLAALGEQSATITHELKQPLNAIQLIATNLLRQVERNPRASLEKLPDKMSKVLLMVERAANLADHIRRSSRTTAGDVEQCSFSDALSNARIMIDPAFLAAGLRLDVDVEDELPLLAISGMRLEQVLLNILDNAKHAVVSSKATTPWVKLEARRISDSMVEVRIEDSGGGIPEKALAHVFDQFFTTKNADEGTGIGLGVCRSIIESAGGAITAHNAEYGASFVMRVPISSESVRPEREIH